MKRDPVRILLLAGFLSLSGSVHLLAQEPDGPHLELPQVLERGDSGPLLLIIPCAGCGARAWDSFMEANQDRFRMLAVTLPGYAGSPRPELPLWTDEPVFQENALDQLSRLLDERDLRKVTVVGHSFGSSLALALYERRPDRVAALVNVDGNPLNPVSRARESPDERAANARSSVDERWAGRLQDPDEWRSFNGAGGMPSPEVRLLHHGLFMATDRVSMLHYWRENFLGDQNPLFRRLDVPYLDIKALRPWDENPDSTLAAHREFMARVGTPPGYRDVVFRSTTHWVYAEHPELLGNVFLDFWAGRPLKDPDTGEGEGP